MTATELADAWTALWNGEMERAEALLTPDFRIHFGSAGGVAVAGDKVLGAGEMAAFIRDFRASGHDYTYAVDAPPMADETGFALRWYASGAGLAVSGIDVMRVEEERIAEVWSLTGARRFPG